MKFSDEINDEKKSGKLRISSYILSGRDGYFEIIGRRYVITNLLLLNITHHCLPNTKRKKYRVRGQSSKVLRQLMIIS